MKTIEISCSQLVKFSKIVEVSDDTYKVLQYANARNFVSERKNQEEYEILEGLISGTNPYDVGREFCDVEITLV